MQTPWFMHSHPVKGNTLVGVLGTGFGTYVRSWHDGELYIAFYPNAPARREVFHIFRERWEQGSPEAAGTEDRADAAVADHQRIYEAVLNG